jgi:hypothetical protein
MQFPCLLSPSLPCASLLFLIPIFLFSQTLRQPTQSSGFKGLVELYGFTLVVILYRDEDENAATLLRDALRPHFKNVKILKRSEGKIKKGVLVIDPSFFIKTKLSWLYGGLEAVQPLSKLLGLLEDENGMQPQNKSKALEVARQALESVRGSDKERWRRLITYLENWETP